MSEPVFRPREVQFVGGPYDGWVYNLAGVPVTDGTPWYNDMKRAGTSLGRYCMYRFSAVRSRMVYEGTFAGSYSSNEEFIQRTRLKA